MFDHKWVVTTLKATAEEIQQGVGMTREVKIKATKKISTQLNFTDQF